MLYIQNDNRYYQNTVKQLILMLGGGFLRQMSETMKYNRDLLGKTQRKPFGKQGHKAHGKTPLTDSRSLTDAEHRELLDKVAIERRREQKKIILTLALSVMLTLFLICLLILFF